ncbi:MAG: rhomboid family intramembrane serine protease [Bacteroidales bacterium]|nr:rhomboid family intramembrane serine protease [Bacteroidales bacterium]
MFPLRDNIPHRHFPYMNWAIILACTAVFLFQLSLNPQEQQAFFYLFGLVPARYSHPEWARFFGLYADNYFPFITNTFMHGGWGHFISNMWILFIFGDNVEDRMGHFRYLLFYLLAGLMASLTHFVLHPASTVPALGASGAIAGVMAAYMFLFPYSRILVLLPILIIPFFFEVSAFVFIAIWFVIQLFSGMTDLMFPAYTSGIAFWAHIGGFLTGLFTFRIFLAKRY